MELQKAYAYYFSPTGTTEKAVKAIAEGTGLPWETLDMTLPKTRGEFKKSFSSNELLIAGMPVYGGRIPTHLEDFFTAIKGDGTPAVVMAMYGNREYEDALIELKIGLEERGFKVIAGAAFIGEHTYSDKVAGGRPNAADLETAREFGKKAVKSLEKGLPANINIKGNYPYVAKGDDPESGVLGPIALIALIYATDDCTRCGLCADNCPWGAITMDEKAVVDHTKCLRCMRCMRVCPVDALKVTDPKYHEMIDMFEKWLAPLHKEPEMFLGGQ